MIQETIQYAEALTGRLKQAEATHDYTTAKQAVQEFIKGSEQSGLMGDVDILDAGIAACHRHGKVVNYDVGTF
jgi:hypothetical protein